MKFASMFIAALAIVALSAPLAAAQDAGISQATDGEKVIVTGESQTRHLFERLRGECLYNVDPAAQFEKNEGCAVIFYGNKKNVRDLPVWVLGFEPGAFRMRDIPVVFVCAIDSFDRHVVKLGEAANGEVIQRTCRQNEQQGTDDYFYQEAVGLNVLRASDYNEKALTEFQEFLHYKKFLAAWLVKESKKFASRNSYSDLFCGSADQADHCPANFFGHTQTPYSMAEWQ